MAVATASLGGCLVQFELEVGPHAAGELKVLELKATEEISRPFQVDLTLVAPRASRWTASPFWGRARSSRSTSS